MPRNSEVIRQWLILRDLELARGGVTIADLAARTGVTTRTIRRDLEALQEAGFSLYDEKIDGRSCWKLETHPFRHLSETGFTLGELSALYFSRTVLECLAATPFQADLQTAFAKLETVLPPRMRQFLDRLPAVIAAKRAPAQKPADPRQHEVIARIIEATLYQRRVSMQYYSFSSSRSREYIIEPSRLVYAEGGLYLFAYVPAYDQTRTFAIARIERLSLLEETFEAPRELPAEVFAHSLGIHHGDPERVEIEFAARVAPYVRERTWHGSQQIREAGGGAIVVTLNVCLDRALRSWILSFGPLAKVLGPANLAAQIFEELDEARARYAPLLKFGGAG